ncbi:rRNA maturation RNase YbeY [Phaeovulum sp.]|uniref:rRNA maturation RNase YbeY n=1 Tax=Phaeovulum sp. TaxID=2934796 RepID=UPI0039E2E2C3
MEPLVDILIEDPRWEAFGLEGLAERAVVAVLSDQTLSPRACEVSILGCDDARIAVLNQDFRGKPVATNVLSWPAEERSAEADGGAPLRPGPGIPGVPEELGDIAIAWETCAREADDHGKPMPDHVTHLLVHGLLHLLGYDHMRDKDAALMEDAETRILARMGIANPYE